MTPNHTSTNSTAAAHFLHVDGCDRLPGFFETLKKKAPNDREYFKRSHWQRPTTA
jgi:hypothetical protein